MQTITKPLSSLFVLAKFNAIITRRLDARLGGLSFTEFQILYYLSQELDEKMRRVDLADKVGLTQSGVTRLLLPMQKIGLVRKEADKHDARVSFVVLAKGGKQKLEEAIERAELFLGETIQANKLPELQELAGLLGDIRL